MLIVVKAGGDLLKDGLPEALIRDIVALRETHKVILVHGGGDIVTDISTKLGHPPKFVLSPKGFKSRYTDKEESSIYTMVMAGKINKEIVTELEKNGISSIGLSGLDAHLIKAERKKQLIIIDERGRRRLIEGGYTGQIKSINTSLISALLDLGVLPVVSPIAQGDEYEALNVDGDRTASAIASALKADRLILLTDVRGIMLNNALVPRLNVRQAEESMEKIGPGMITKVYAAVEAVKNGVKEAIIASGLIADPLTDALENMECTVISN
ncbi:MAG: [LysW]-aminoadipate/[LysW]-glutamate kinase [Candidatus Bathyarchaeota archaeon]